MCLKCFTITYSRLLSKYANNQCLVSRLISQIYLLYQSQLNILMNKRFLPLLALLGLIINSFAATSSITNSGFVFSPSSVTITAGDTVIFSLGGSHNAIEVDQVTYNANGNTPLGGGFAVPFGGGVLTGLTVGTHYYVCGNHFSMGMKGMIIVQPAVVIPNVWINEIHYENISNDTLEGYEIAGDAGIDLGCFRVFLQSGTIGTPIYDVDTLAGTIPNSSGCGYGTVWFQKPTGGLQNGPDAIVLEYAPIATQCGVNHTDTILQFLSYEGSITSTSGRTNGLVSTNINVSETSSAAVGTSLQLQGIGTTYSQFTWTNSAVNTYNTINNNQFLCGAPIASYRFQPVSITVVESAGTVVAGYVKASNVNLQSQNVTAFLKTGNGADVSGFFQQMFTFNPGGVDSFAFTLTITDDAVVEGTENLVFVLRNPSANGTLETDSLFTLTITDNDVAPNPTVSFNTANTITSEGSAAVNVQVVISSPNANPTSVDVNVMGGGTATPGGVDYSFSPLTVTFPANSSAPQNVVVNIVDDVVAEGTESFSFQLNNATNGAIIGANNQHTVTILDNDTLQFTIHPSAFTQAENLGTAFVPVRLTSTSTNNTSVTLQLVSAGTTATNGNDFSFADTTLTWLAGSSGTRQVPVIINDDNLYELNELVRFRLVNPTNGAVFANDTFCLTIVNDEPAPAGNCSNLFFSEYIEGSSNNKAIEIFNPTSSVIDLSEYRIYKSINAGSTTSVFGLNGTLAAGDVYVVANGQADTMIKQQADTLSGFFNFNGDDALALLHLNDTIDIIGEFGIQPTSGWLVDTGSTSQHTLVRSFYNYEGDNDWDNAVETWKVYHVDMFDSLGAHHTAPCGTPEPVPASTIRFFSIDTTVAEGAFTLEVIVETTNPSNSTVSYFVARDDAASTAVAGSDYIYTNQQIFGPPGVSYDTSYLEVKDDALIESTEQVILRFLNVGPNITVGSDSIYTLTITDSDVLQVSFLGAAFNHVEDEGTVPVKVTISTPVADTTKVSVQLAQGNATTGVDFTFNDTTVVFLPNTIDTQMIWVTIIDDTLDEGTEQVNFDLINATNSAIILTSAYTLYIIDNEMSGFAEDYFESNVSVFPNPATHTLNIESSRTLFHVSITDLTGSTVFKSETLASGKNRIDISALPVGMYFINIWDNEKVCSRRFVKTID